MSWKSAIALVIVATVLVAGLVSLDLKIVAENEMDGLYVALLDVAIVGLPLFLTAGVFHAYRSAYLAEHPDRADHVAWSAYLPAMTLFCLLVVFCALVLLRYDSHGSLYFSAKEAAQSGHPVRPSLVLGRSSIPLYFTVGDDYQSVRVPTAMFWVALVGAFVSILGTLLRRFVIGHLVARTYLYAAAQILYAMIAAAVFFIAAQAWPELLGQRVGDPVGKRNLLLVFAFFAGMFPHTIFQWVTRQARTRLGLGGRSPLALTDIQGLEPEMETFLHEEGVWSLSDLATRDPQVLARGIHLGEGLVTRWRDQARLLVELGDRALVEHFRQLGIHAWDDLKVLSDVEPAVKLDDLTAAPAGPAAVSPVLIRVLRNKYEATVDSGRPERGAVIAQSPTP